MMETIKKVFRKLFNGLNMSWKNVIIFAVIAGAYTGLINSLPFLDFLQETSFTDIAVTYEWWIFFAVIIAANCKKPVEAGLKVFVFFLISQPLVYLVEVPFKGWGVFVYYRYWFYMTLMTLPGAMVAWYGTHKKDIWAALIMCVATGFLSAYVSSLVKVSVSDFWKIHILTILFCVMQIVVYIFYFIKKPVLRALAVVLNIGLLIAFGFYHLNNETQSLISLPGLERWSGYEITNGDRYRVELNDNDLVIYAKPHAQETELVLTTEDGEKLYYRLMFDEKKILRSEITKSELELSVENVEFIQENMDYVSWREFEVYEMSRCEEEGDSDDETSADSECKVAVYPVGEKYELVLSGRNGDLIGNIYLRAVKDGKKIDLAKDDVMEFIEKY